MKRNHQFDASHQIHFCVKIMKDSDGEMDEQRYLLLCILTHKYEHQYKYKLTGSLYIFLILMKIKDTNILKTN